jgi:hypothetical protein
VVLDGIRDPEHLAQPAATGKALGHPELARICSAQARAAIKDDHELLLGKTATVRRRRSKSKA